MERQTALNGTAKQNSMSVKFKTFYTFLSYIVYYVMY